MEEMDGKRDKRGEEGGGDQGTGRWIGRVGT